MLPSALPAPFIFSALRRARSGTGTFLEEPGLISFLACLESSGFKPIPVLWEWAGGAGFADVWHQHRISFAGIPALPAPGCGWRSWKGLQGIPSHIRGGPGKIQAHHPVDDPKIPKTGPSGWKRAGLKFPKPDRCKSFGFFGAKSSSSCRNSEKSVPSSPEKLQIPSPHFQGYKPAHNSLSCAWKREFDSQLPQALHNIPS